MKKIFLAALAALAAVAVAVPAFAEVACADSGDPPTKFDPSLPPKILKWVSGVEKQFSLQPPTSKESATQLQAAIAKWRRQTAPESVDSFFRSAVAHGAAAQYEDLMIKAEPSKADDHRFWRDIEAARADACLKLTRPQ